MSSSFKLPVRSSTILKVLWTDILQSYFLGRRLNTACHSCQLRSMGYRWVHLSVRGTAETLPILGQVQLCALGSSGCWDCRWPNLSLLLVSELLSVVPKKLTITVCNTQWRETLAKIPSSSGGETRCTNVHWTGKLPRCVNFPSDLSSGSTLPPSSFTVLKIDWHRFLARHDGRLCITLY